MKKVWKKCFIFSMFQSFGSQQSAVGNILSLKICSLRTIAGSNPGVRKSFCQIIKSQIFHACSVLVYSSLHCTFCTSQLLCLASLYFCIFFCFVTVCHIPSQSCPCFHPHIQSLCCTWYIFETNIIAQCKVSQHLKKAFLGDLSLNMLCHRYE